MTGSRLVMIGAYSDRGADAFPPREWLAR